MTEMPDIVIAIISAHDLRADWLRGFERYQQTEIVWYWDGDTLRTRRDVFVDQWDDERLAEIVAELRRCLEAGGAVVGARRDGVTVGFGNVEPARFGPEDEYLELSLLHVTNRLRRSGIGRRLFDACCAEARRMGARKLYISGHPADETQRFYRSLGCVPAVYVHPPLVEREPYDIQLEYVM